MLTMCPILNTDSFGGRDISAADAFSYRRERYLAKKACIQRKIVLYCTSKDQGVMESGS